MKRSEMLLKIHDKLVGQEMRHDWPNQLLTAMEELGMAPPTYTSLPDSYNRSEGTMGYDVNEWEPEDEHST